MTATAIAEERTAALEPLQPRPDQPERWHSFSEPVPFDVAAEKILAAAASAPASGGATRASARR
ncbi:MAG TPA: hypothetical protein RMH85_12105 [Polyangiaceae bacterium LLY-WYZ-15_(1-7)]|nr:hypothetical protein [Sandaracinus sp.]HJK93164.1 hypothetical protein [Polyangiaceae bacterium LLY-WYZ-15_(1-7)]MBJ73554.1 hypothetical protein [Sandaracinus sp.]HJL06632.1 hypothetical protein [Polyangiaceae bacterium LLY-WYZ-15_(1-7)]HJL09238.1 hypothetical protein [Polyangiaceae bacterium LLY-WYZ-15_(1-7)]|tara:strand:+ start:502 stop:693 length:192 start_codon:yes stop_codon:yes gene_type:complete